MISVENVIYVLKWLRWNTKRKLEFWLICILWIHGLNLNTNKVCIYIYIYVCMYVYLYIHEEEGWRWRRVVCFISNCGSTWNWNQLGPVTAMKERPVKPAVYAWNGNNVLSVCPLYPWKWSSHHLFGLYDIFFKINF